MLDCQDDQRRYLLSEDDHNEIYNSYIQRALAQVSNGRSNPVAYFLGAQPGSGKTKLRQAILQTDDAVVINTDDFRWFHPEYNQLLENPKTNEKGSHYVNPDASNWSIRLFNEAIEKRCSIIVDSTLGGNVSHFVTRINELHKVGYRNEIHLLAVNPLVSMLGIYLRFENGWASGVPERMVSIEVHNRNYNKLPDNLKKIDEACSNMLDKICVYSRNQNSELNPICLLEKPYLIKTALDMLHHERTRQLNKEESNNFDRTVWGVRYMIESRRGDASRFLKDMS